MDRRGPIADLVQQVLERNDGKDYQLVTNAVMPTHVHVVFRLLGELDDVLQQWKSVTSHRANRMLKRTGAFWAEDYYDVLIRDSRQLERTVRYVRNNPSKAELMEWRWSKFWPETFAQCI